MFKLVVLVLAVAASALADSQVVKTGLVGSHIVPAGSAYVHAAPVSGYAAAPVAGYAAGYAAAPVAGYSAGYTAGAVYPQYQQYAQYPYSGYSSGYAAYPGYQNLVAPMPYAPVASAGYAAYPSQYLYQQKNLAATPAHTAYSVL